jgi:hypothetical protein
MVAIDRLSARCTHFAACLSFCTSQNRHVRAAVLAVCGQVRRVSEDMRQLQDQQRLQTSLLVRMVYVGSAELLRL